MTESRDDHTVEHENTLAEFHDRYRHQRLPDWARAKEEPASTIQRHDLGKYAIELDEQSRILTISGTGSRLALDAQEAIGLLHWLYAQRDILYRLAYVDELPVMGACPYCGQHHLEQCPLKPD